ncbi:MAG: hypothetical protein QM571_02155 [Micrococcaceae bacterium]
MSIPESWIPHKRTDKELLGWITPEGENFIVIDLLGRKSEPLDWVSAEEYLEELGLSYLAEPFKYQISSDNWIRVRIVEVSTKEIVIKAEDYGDVTADTEKYRLPFPITNVLRPLTSQ